MAEEDEGLDEEEERGLLRCLCALERSGVLNGLFAYEARPTLRLGVTGTGPWPEEEEALSNPSTTIVAPSLLENSFGVVPPSLRLFGVLKHSSPSSASSSPSSSLSTPPPPIGVRSELTGCWTDDFRGGVHGLPPSSLPAKAAAALAISLSSSLSALPVLRLFLVGVQLIPAWPP